MSQQSNKVFEFGDFRLDAQEGVLTRCGEPIPLSPKVFQTLHLLVEKHGHVISKAEMMDAIWPDLFVEESNLTQNIYVLRRVLAAEKNGERFIENVPRRGYRFVAPVHVRLKVESEAEVDEEHHISASPSPLLSPTHNLRTVPAGSRSDFEDRRVKPTVKRPAISSLVLLAAGIAILAGLGFAGYKYLSASGDKQMAAPIEHVDFKKLTFTGDLTFPVIAPDGNSFAFLRSGKIIVQNIATGDEMPLNVTGESVFGILQYSRDGNSIYFRDRVSFDLSASVFRVSRFGGQATLTAENVWSGFGFSPDDKQMSFVRVMPNAATSRVIVKDLETGVERSLATLNLPSIFLGNGYPAWSPDGKKIAVVVFKNMPGAPISELAIIDVETGQIDAIQQSQLGQYEQAVWLPDNSGLVISAREAGKFFQLWLVSYPSGELKRITNDLNIYRGVSLSADGSRLLTRQFTLYSHLWTGETKDLRGLQQRTFGNLNRDGVGGLGWTPDGDVIYVARIMEDYDIWLYRPADDSRRQITKNVGELNRSPVVSADGKHIFFDSNRTGADHIWQMDSNGEDQKQITFGENEIDLYPQVSPDKQWLYYIQKGAKASRVRRISLTDGRSEAMTDPANLSPDSFLSLSPDGQSLAFLNAVEKVDEQKGKETYQVAIIPTDKHAGPVFVNISASRLIVQWSPDGSALDYIVNTAAGAQIWRQPLAGNGQPTVVVDLPKSFLHNFAWSADGEKLVLSRGQQANDAILLTNFRP